MWYLFWGEVEGSTIYMVYFFWGEAEGTKISPVKHILFESKDLEHRFALALFSGSIPRGTSQTTLHWKGIPFGSLHEV